MMRLFDLFLQEIRQDLNNPIGQGRSTMAPTPYGHPTDLEKSGGFPVAAENDFEDEIEPAGGHAPIEAARRCYGVGT
jgi:hypothetical protein